MITEADVERRWLEMQMEGQRRKDTLMFHAWLTGMYPSLSAPEQAVVRRVVVGWLGCVDLYSSKRWDARAFVGEHAAKEALPEVNREVARLRTLLSGIEQCEPRGHAAAVVRGELGMYQELAERLSASQAQA